MEWKYCVKRETTVFPAFGVTESFSRISKILDIPFDYKHVRFVDGEWWYAKDEYAKFQELLRQKVNEDLSYFFSLIEKQILRGEELKKYVLAPDSLSSYIEHMHNFYAFWWVAIPASEILEKKVRDVLHAKKSSIEFEDLIFTRRELELSKERRLLLESDVDFEQHAAQYGWISTSYHLGNPLTAEDFKVMKSVLNVDMEKEKIQNEKKRKEQLLAKVSELFSDAEVNIVRAMQDIIFLRNYQKETVNECQHKSERFLKEEAQQRGVSWGQFLSSTPEEVLLNTCPKDDRKEWAIILEEGKTFLTEDVDRYRVSEQKERGFDSEVKGSIACKGHVKGRVRVIRKKSDINDFTEGEILVTTMTSIDFVHVMKKASAIVTDEGGITCHAAIFSRELHVPCVIGTRNATALLETGDYVEVDANTGIVRKI